MRRLSELELNQLVVVDALQKLSNADRQQCKGSWKFICDFTTKLQESYDRRTKIMKLVQEALAQLRLDMKYLVFDLEATKRERDELRRRLDDRS